MKVARPTGIPVEICILAGGLSSRMGRDKARLQLGRKTFLGQIRSTAKALNLPVRTIRRDLTDRCGPLGGIYTALKTSSAGKIVFLACDMPFVSSDLLRKIIAQFDDQRASQPSSLALFTSDNRSPGFPFILAREASSTVDAQLAREIFSLKALAKALEARFYRPTRAEKELLFNINTPAEFDAAKDRLTAKAAGDASGTSRKGQDYCKSPSRNRGRLPGKA